MDKLIVNEKVRKDIEMGMNIIPREEYTSILVTISNLAANTVKRTLGPYAHTTIIDDGTFTYPTKDGWSVLSRLRFSDPIYNTLFKLLQDISFRVVNKVGDGTTTAVVAADHFIAAMNTFLEDCEKQGKIIRQTDFLKAINTARDMVVKSLSSDTFCHHIDPTGDLDEIWKIAYTSTNSDENIANIIHTIYKETRNPNILVKLGTKPSVEYHIETGFRLDAKLLNSRLYKNTSDGYYQNNDNEPIKLVIFDHNVTYSEHKDIIMGLIEWSNQTGQLLMIAAPYFDDIIASVMQAALEKCYQGGAMPGIFMVQIPMGTISQKDAANDFAMLAGATMINAARVRAYNLMIHNLKAEVKGQDKIEDDVLQIQEFREKTPTELIEAAMGLIRKAVMSDSAVTISEYSTDSLLYKNTLADVEKEFNEQKEKMRVSTTNLQREYMEIYQRYNRLKGAMGVIEVGGQSELERQCIKDSVDDAVLACRSAYDEGYVFGLNISTLRAIYINNQQMGMQYIAHYANDEMEWLICNALRLMYDSFLNTSLDVMHNKYPSTYDHWCGMEGLTAKKMFGAVLLAPYSEECSIESEIKETLDALHLNGLHTSGFDIVSEEIITDDMPTIINSMGTDVEIINAMCSIITLILSSDQFLSMNRTYDKREAMKEALDTKIEQETAITTAKAKAVVDCLKSSGLLLSSPIIGAEGVLDTTINAPIINEC